MTDVRNKHFAIAMGLAVLATPTLTGCGTVGSRLIANEDDYAAYRKVRTSARIDTRLVASAAYLDAHPNGQWEHQVRPWFDRAEARYWNRIKETRAGLSTYLRNLPNGPHAAQAAQALAAYRDNQKSARKELLLLKAAMTEQRLASLAQQRDQAFSAFTEWLGRILSINTWGRPTSHLDHETIFAWRIDPPKGTCSDNLCSKLVLQTYQLPGGGENAERQLLMDVILILDQGRLHEVRLAGPGLFSRLYETGANQIVNFDDSSSRSEAISYAIQVVGGAAQAQLPAQKCALAPLDPIIFNRSCNGWTLTMTAAVSPADDDVVSVIGPQPASLAPSQTEQNTSNIK